MVAVGLLGSGIGAVEGMGHGAGNRPVGNAEHRLLEADADLHMRIHLTTTMAVVPGTQFLWEVAEHIGHAEAGGDAGTHTRDGIGVESSVFKAADIRGNLLGLGVVRHSAKEGHTPEKHSLHIRNSHIHQEGETRLRRQNPDLLVALRHFVGNRMGCGRDQAIADVMHHIIDAGHFADFVATCEIDENVAHHPPKQAQGVDGGE